MFIQRTIGAEIVEKIKNTNKIIVLYGARQVGKTTLVKKIIPELNLKCLSINADEEKYNSVLSSKNLDKIKSLVSGYQLLFIDEAQRIDDIGLNLKIIADELPNLKVIATGSSSFELANKLSEPLTGRAWMLNLFPLAVCELLSIYNEFELNSKLEDILVFGSYPEIFTTKNHMQKRELLEIVGRSYLYKDILELATVKHSSKIKDLLKLLAFQVGSEVSINEVSNSLNISREAVERYIDLFEKAYVLFRVKGFSRNLRKEVSKMNKIYFYDTGMRNVVIDNLKPLKDRNDVGQLWENFLMSERQKIIAYQHTYAASYFWRTNTGAELDYVEEKDGELFGYEFKYGKSKPRPPKSWLETYPGSTYELINKENFFKFVS